MPTTAAVEVESPPNDKVPVVVIVPPRTGKVVAILVIVPAEAVRQEPPNLKHPPVNSSPLAKVLVAVVDVAVM